MNDLFAAALATFRNAHAPYSGFRVGAGVRSGSGRVYAGANVENASYPEGNCAETSAIAAMVAAGEREIREVLVVAAGERLCSPCGGCRQRLAEFAGPQVPVHLCSPEGLRRTVSLGELLPLAFGLGEGARPGPRVEPEGDSREMGRRDEPEDGQEGRGGALEVIRARAPGLAPRVGMILGSGLGGLADAIEDAIAIPYADLPGFPRPGVAGHAGRLVLGRLAGVAVACLQGRAHLYEGLPARAVNVPIRTLKSLGCEILILTNASGSLRPETGAGSVALLTDHINLLGTNPLVGPNDDATGPRFPELSEVYDAALRARVEALAEREGIELTTGVYLATLGPSFETPAEIRAFRTLGADLVGMSTVPEAISARHCGLRVVALSAVTNLAAGLSGSPLSHEETLREAARAGESIGRLIRALLEELARS